MCWSSGASFQPVQQHGRTCRSSRNAFLMLLLGDKQCLSGDLSWPIHDMGRVRFWRGKYICNVYLWVVYLWLGVWAKHELCNGRKYRTFLFQTTNREQEDLPPQVSPPSASLKCWWSSIGATGLSHFALKKEYGYYCHVLCYLNKFVVLEIQLLLKLH